jgi:hypothetical protein
VIRAPLRMTAGPKIGSSEDSAPGRFKS